MNFQEDNESKVIGKISNIDCVLKDRNIKLETAHAYFALPYFQTKNSLFDLDQYIKFIKKIETIVRTHPDYKGYISLLLDKGLGNCSILGNINRENAEVEMHHGPIFTLYDICSIIADHLMRVQGSCSSFEVAERVLDEHYMNRVQVVFLSETVHQLTHTTNQFISMKQAYGDLNAFLEKYKEDISDSQKNIINRYLDLAEKYETDYSDILKLRDTIKTFH